MLCIDSKAAETEGIRDLRDWEEQNPGRLEGIKRWFELVKTYDGKKANWFENGR